MRNATPTRMRVVAATLSMILVGSLSAISAASPATAAVRERNITFQTRQTSTGPNVRSIEVLFQENGRTGQLCLNFPGNDFPAGISRWPDFTVRLPNPVEVTSFSDFWCERGTAYASTSRTIDTGRYDRYTVYATRGPKMNI
jgi:hypothetical protein